MEAPHLAGAGAMRPYRPSANEGEIGKMGRMLGTIPLRSQTDVKQCMRADSISTGCYWNDGRRL
jgi:hypothetical protein